MRKIAFLMLVFGSLGAVLLAACTPAGGKDPAAAAVENYLQALVSEDSNRLSTSSCSAWEEQATLEMDAFIGVKAQLQGLSCQKTGMDGDAALVECQGKILATYNNEQQELPVSGRTYEVVQEGGDWRVCGTK